MKRASTVSLLSVSAGVVVMSVLVAGVSQNDQSKQAKKPSLTLTATPTFTFAPAKIRLLAEIKDGPDDYADLYCPTVEWDWDDGTTSSSSPDCEPYVAGETRIQRRFSTTHEYREAGTYKIQIRLKKKDRVVLAASATVQVNPGVDPALGR